MCSLNNTYVKKKTIMENECSINDLNAMNTISEVDVFIHYDSLSLW